MKDPAYTRSTWARSFVDFKNWKKEAGDLVSLSRIGQQILASKDATLEFGHSLCLGWNVLQFKSRRGIVGGAKLTRTHPLSCLEYIDKISVWLYFY